MTERISEWVPWWHATVAAPTPRMHVVVAERMATVVGFAPLGSARGEDVDSVGELYAIYVHPTAWGEGIGRALMGETLRRLRAEGFREAMLWVLEDNPRTRRFYERSGWHVDGGTKDEEWLGSLTREVRYRIVL